MYVPSQYFHSAEILMLLAITGQLRRAIMQAERHMKSPAAGAAWLDRQGLGYFRHGSEFISGILAGSALSLSLDPIPLSRSNFASQIQYIPRCQSRHGHTYVMRSAPFISERFARTKGALSSELAKVIAIGELRTITFVRRRFHASSQTRHLSHAVNGALCIWIKTAWRHVRVHMQRPQMERGKKC